VLWSAETGAMARKLANTEERFGEYLTRLGETIGHADRREPLRAYMAGLLLPGERKSVEPMAAKVDPRNVESRHQSMHHFVADAPWDAAGVNRVARDWALEQFDRHAPIQAWVIDDTGIPKKGKHSVGVARQYCGVLGKQDNCQVAVSITLTNEVLSVPAAYRLYLPESWAEDRARRRVARVPEDVEFRRKWQIALDQIDALLADGIPRAPVVMDAGYGTTTELRDELAARDLLYVAGVQGEVTVWPEGEQPLAPKPYGGRGRPPTLLRRSEDAKPLSVATLALQLPKTAWRSIRWRGGTKGDMRLPICSGSRSRRPSGQLAPRASTRGMAPDRMAHGRGTSHQVLAIERRGGCDSDRPRPPRQGALAHRTRLPRTQRRDRDRPLRRTGVGRLSSPRSLMHRRIRVSGSRACSAFPPCASRLPRSPSRTPRFPPTGKSR